MKKLLALFFGFSLFSNCCLMPRQYVSVEDSISSQDSVQDEVDHIYYTASEDDVLNEIAIELYFCPVTHSFVQDLNCAPGWDYVKEASYRHYAVLFRNYLERFVDQEVSSWSYYQALLLNNDS